MQARYSTSLHYADKHFGPWHPSMKQFDLILRSSLSLPLKYLKSGKNKARQDPKLMYMRPHILHAGHLLKWQGPLDTDRASVSNVPQAS